MSKYPIKNLSMERVTSKVPQTRTARMARARLGYLMSGFGDEAGLYHNVQERVPEAWATLAEDLPCEEPRVKAQFGSISQWRGSTGRWARGIRHG